MLSAMSPVPQETYCVTDDDTDGASGRINEETEDEHDRRRVRIAWQERLRKGVRHLMRLEPRGNMLPEVGTRCIVMVGNARQDFGQMAEVTDQKVHMVGIKYRGAKNRRLEYKVKRPSSLMMLEAGLTVKQDKHGTVWVCVEE
jgi:hypothetical protein